jgi:hypothetical protein
MVGCFDTAERSCFAAHRELTSGRRSNPLGGRQMTANRGRTCGKRINTRVGLFSLIPLLAPSFSRMKVLAGGLISLFSHQVHSFFVKLCGVSRATNQRPRAASRQRPQSGTGRGSAHSLGKEHWCIQRQNPRPFLFHPGPHSSVLSFAPEPSFLLLLKAARLGRHHFKHRIGAILCVCVQPLRWMKNWSNRRNITPESRRRPLS